jgi:iron complex outermembrane receptor protein
MSLLCRSLPKGAGKRLLLLLFLTPLYLLAQSQEINGTVKDSTGRPMAGVSVSVKGKNIVAVTKSDGRFIVPAQTGDVLVFSGVSLEDQDVLIGSKTTFDVIMRTSAQLMGDVVVVGYGKSSRKTLSSAVTSVKPEDLNRGAISDVGQLLQGKVPGLNISASGDPNRPAAVVLRGTSTINSPGGPFYVIDNVPGADISTIAPDDIESMEVGKDAAATAIYGNKASNGVIIVTTKRGKKGAMQTTYSGYVGLEKVSNGLELMDSAQIRSYVAKNGYSILPADDKGASTDWMKAIQRDGAFSHNHNLSFSGGTEKTTYSASINYFSKEGILLKSKLDRIIARMYIEHRALNDKVKFGLGVVNSNSKASNTPLQNTVLEQATKHLPVSPVYNADGTYFENPNIPSYFNPVSLINNAQDDTKYNTLQANFNTEVKLPLGLTYNLNLSHVRNSSLHGEYYNSYYSKNYNSPSFYNNPDPGFAGHTNIAFGTNGVAYRSSYQNAATTIENWLTWDKRFGEHHINAVLGYSWQNNTTGDGLQASNTNFLSDYTGYNTLWLGNYQQVQSSYNVDFGGTYYQETRFISDFGRLNYGYNDKYLLQASVRRDGSSIFGRNKEWGYFPSVGAAWRISQEEFMSNVPVINELKLRASYGETGNAFGLGAYTAQQLFTRQGTYYDNGSVFAAAYGITQGANPDLQWEVTSTKNLGLDYAILKNKVTGSIDVYEKETSDMIFGYRVSPALVPGGFIYANGGKLRNRGIEFSVNVNAVSTKDFTWNSGLNLASNKNVILDLHGPAQYGINSDSLRYSYPEGPGMSGVSVQILSTGHAVGEFFTHIYRGKNDAGKSLFLYHDGKDYETAVPVKEDFFVGSPHPKLLVGWSNSFRYKSFDLNLFVRGVFGNKIFNATRANLSYTQNATTNNLIATAYDDKMTDARNNNYSTRYMEDGSYIRLDNATLGYRVPIKNDYIKSLRFYVTGNNIFVITKYKGVDPEVNMGGIALGVDNNNFYPKTRTFLFGASVGF